MRHSAWKLNIQVFMCVCRIVFMLKEFPCPYHIENVEAICNFSF